MQPDAPLMVSVSGIRGIVGRSMTPEVAARFAATWAAYVGETSGRRSPALCVARDPRPSGDGLLRAVVSGVASTGARVIDLGVVATPTAGVMVTARRADGALVITASHNPPEWNGLKCITGDGAAPQRAVAEEISRRFSIAPAIGGPPAAAAEADPGGDNEHVRRVLAAVDAGPIRRAALKVVLDSNAGAGARSGRMLLEALGCRLVQLNGEPDGRFAHGLEPVGENLGDLARATVAEGADVGFAQDPDADRLAIVDETGEPIGEEYTLALAARRVMETAGPGPIVTNLSTSRMIDDLAARYPGASVLRTPVGEANVVAAMDRCGAAIGGEGNGGVIFAPVCRIRDSLSSMALVLGLRAAAGRSLSAIVAEQPRYVMIKQKAELDPGASIDAALARVAERFAGARIDTADGVRADLDDGWVHVRPSNTEPIVRVIAEAPSARRARELIEAATASTAPP